jgi:hypothetical protein
MKIGDLVRLKAYPSFAPIGLIVSIERRPGFYGGDRGKVQWFGSRNYVQYRGLNELEVINESR